MAYIIRVETGTIDRAVYQIAALYDGSRPSPLHPDTSWNGRGHGIEYLASSAAVAAFNLGNTAGAYLGGRAIAVGYGLTSPSVVGTA